MSDWGMGLGWLTMTMLVLAVGWVIWSGVREGNRPAGGNDKVVELLDRRYASGDIGRDEYLERKRDLEG